MIDIHTSANANAEKGVSGEGLMTAVQPAASAAPNLRVIIAEGKFQGVNIDLYAKKSVEHYADIGEALHDTDRLSDCYISNIGGR